MRVTGLSIKANSGKTPDDMSKFASIRGFLAYLGVARSCCAASGLTQAQKRVLSAGEFAVHFACQQAALQT